MSTGSVRARRIKTTDTAMRARKLQPLLDNSLTICAAELRLARPETVYRARALSNGAIAQGTVHIAPTHPGHEQRRETGGASVSPGSLR